MDENYMHPKIKDQAPKVLWDFYISLIINQEEGAGQASYQKNTPSYRQWSESCNNFRELLVLDPES